MRIGRKKRGKEGKRKKREKIETEKTKGRKIENEKKIKKYREKGKEITSKKKSEKEREAEVKGNFDQSEQQSSCCTERHLARKKKGLQERKQENFEHENFFEELM